MGWESDTTFHKLTLAAFFHDITISKPELAEFETMEQANKIGSRTDFLEVKGHPMAAAEVLRKFREIPPDVDVIVAQHHERPNGKGLVSRPIIFIVQ